MNIKNELLAKEPETLTDKHTRYTLKNKEGERQLYLGDVFNELPHGLIYKHETGMGATHLEMLANRNSIIVEPLKVIAASKHLKLKNSIYVGSPTKDIPDPPTNKEIKEYVQNNTTKYKKVLVVADSLERVINAIGNNVYNDYFLLIDEADSFQMDVSFRPRMNICVDYYKKFAITKRAMISATFMAFSDPELKLEAFTEFKYEQTIKRTISLISYATVKEHKWNDPISLLLGIIKKVHSQYPMDKIFVAYNNLSGCKEIAERIHSETSIFQHETKIMCSSTNIRELNKYYAEPSSGILPGKLNLCTCAYFSGYDIDESYHLISFSNTKNLIFTLSDKKLKQIAGRARKGLKSETIVYDTRSTLEDGRNNLKIEDVIDAAELQCKALHCMQERFNENELLRGNLNRLKDLLTQADEEPVMNFIYIDKEGKPRISYLNIDAYLESIRIQYDLYSDFDILKNILNEEGHTVIEEDFFTEGTVIEGENIYEVKKQREVNEIIEHLSKLTEHDTVNTLIRTMILSNTQKFICEVFNDFRYHVDNSQLLMKLQEKASSKDSRAIQNFVLKTYIRLLPPDEHIKVIVNSEITVDKSYTGEELKNKWNLINGTFGLGLNARSEIAAIRYIKLLFSVGRETGGKRKIQTLKQDSDSIDIKKTLPKGRNYPAELHGLFAIL